jgi:hypothetical protein
MHDAQGGPLAALYHQSKDFSKKLKHKGPPKTVTYGIISVWGKFNPEAWICQSSNP